MSLLFQPFHTLFFSSSPLSSFPPLPSLHPTQISLLPTILPFTDPSLDTLTPVTPSFLCHFPLPPFSLLLILPPAAPCGSPAPTTSLSLPYMSVSVADQKGPRRRRRCSCSMRGMGRPWLRPRWYPGGHPAGRKLGLCCPGHSGLAAGRPKGSVCRSVRPRVPDRQPLPGGRGRPAPLHSGRHPPLAPGSLG